MQAGYVNTCQYNFCVLLQFVPCSNTCLGAYLTYFAALLSQFSY